MPIPQVFQDEIDASNQAKDQAAAEETTVKPIFQEEVNASEQIKKEQRKDPVYTDSIARYIRSMMMAASGGSYENVSRTNQGTFIGAYGIPAAQWANWASAAGFPGASWKDPRAQDAVARWAAQNLYNSLGDWGLVSIAWRYGTQEAFRFKNKHGIPTTKTVAGVWDEAEGALISEVVAGMSPEDASSRGRPLQPRQMGDIQLRFTMEEGDTVLEPIRQPNPAHIALSTTLGHMADAIAGGSRAAIESIELTQLGDQDEEEEEKGVSNVTPEDVATPSRKVRWSDG